MTQFIIFNQEGKNVDVWCYNAKLEVKEASQRNTRNGYQQKSAPGIFFIVFLIGTQDCSSWNVICEICV